MCTEFEKKLITNELFLVLFNINTAQSFGQFSGMSEVSVPRSTGDTYASV